MQMGYQRIVKRVETRTETIVELQIFSSGLEQFTEFAYCSVEQLSLAQPDFEEVQLIPAEHTISVTLEDTDEEPIGPWSPDPRIDRVLQEVRQERALQAQLDFLRESKKAWRRKNPSRLSRLFSSVGSFVGRR